MANNARLVGWTFAKAIALAFIAFPLWIAQGNAVPDGDDSLLKMAHQRFDKSTDAMLHGAQDEAFFRNVANGLPTVYARDEDDFDDTSGWPSVRAEWIVWLCTDPDASKLVTYLGIQLTGAQIDGAIDLDGATVPFGLSLRTCAFKGDITLRGAHLPALDLTGSHIRVLSADGCQFDHTVALAYGFEANGEVSLVEANIGGDLNCSDGHFNYADPTSYSLSADSVKIAGYAYFNDSRHGGRVKLVNAYVGGDLNCSDAHLNSQVGLALDAQGMVVNGNAFFESGFTAQSEVNLLRAEVNGYFFWQGVASPKSAVVRLEAAKIGTLWDDLTSWPDRGGLILNGFSYHRIVGASSGAQKRLEWLRRMPAGQFQPQPYEQLAAALRDMGFEQDATDVLVGMNREHGRILNQQLSAGDHSTKRQFFPRWFARLTRKEWWWYHVFGPLIGYGYEPLRALYISLGFVVLGGALFKLGYSRGLMWPPADALHDMQDAGEPFKCDGGVRVPKDYSRFNALIYSLEAFTPLLQLDQDAHWRPNANRGGTFRVLRWRLTTGGLLRAYLWFHVIAGWILTTLWVGAVSGLVKG